MKQNKWLQNALLVRAISQQQPGKLKIYFENSCEWNTTKCHLVVHKYDIHYSLGL